MASAYKENSYSPYSGPSGTPVTTRLPFFPLNHPSHPSTTNNNGVNNQNNGINNQNNGINNLNNQPFNPLRPPTTEEEDDDDDEYGDL